MGALNAADIVVVLDLIGIFAFAMDGALVAAKHDLDIVGWFVLAVLTATGGGLMRDLLIGDVPPAVFTNPYYLSVAIAGGLAAWLLTLLPEQWKVPLVALDAIGLSLFAVTGAQKALDFGLNPPAAMLLGALTAVGGGTIRDVVVREIPAILNRGLYAIPALVGAAIAVVGVWVPAPAGTLAIFGAIACFAIRMLGVTFRLNAPRPPMPR